MGCRACERMGSTISARLFFRRQAHCLPLLPHAPTLGSCVLGDSIFDLLVLEALQLVQTILSWAGEKGKERESDKVIRKMLGLDPKLTQMRPNTDMNATFTH